MLVILKMKVKVVFLTKMGKTNAFPEFQIIKKMKRFLLKMKTNGLKKNILQLIQHKTS